MKNGRLVADNLRTSGAQLDAVGRDQFAFADFQIHFTRDSKTRRRNSITVAENTDPTTQLILRYLSEAKSDGLLCDFRVIEHAEAFPTQADEGSILNGLRDFATTKKIGLGRRFGSNKNHFGWFPSQALLISVGRELRNVFPCEYYGRLLPSKGWISSEVRSRPSTHRAFTDSRRV